MRRYAASRPTRQRGPASLPPATREGPAADAAARKWERSSVYGTRTRWPRASVPGAGHALSDDVKSGAWPVSRRMDQVAAHTRGLARPVLVGAVGQVAALAVSRPVGGGRGRPRHPEPPKTRHTAAQALWWAFRWPGRRCVSDSRPGPRECPPGGQPAPRSTASRETPTHHRGQLVHCWSTQPVIGHATYFTSSHASMAVAGPRAHARTAALRARLPAPGPAAPRRPPAAA